MIVLETANLLFREHEPTDIEPYCEMEADPEVRRYVGGSPRPREAAERNFHTVRFRPAPDRMKLWATVFKPDGRYIGYCGIYPLLVSGRRIPAEGVLAFYLARPYWGRGLATEAGRAFVAFGFDGLRLRRIVASTEIGNIASIRVLDKLGFIRLGMESIGERSFENFELRNPLESHAWDSHSG